MSGKIQEAALRYLSSRSRTVWEMKTYLRRKGFAEEEVSALIADFSACGYLDDADYCMEYFRFAFHRGKGKRKVFYELREKGVEPSLVEIAFEDYLAEAEDFDERARARGEAEKVLRTVELPEDGRIPEKLLGRIGRKLQAKGYSSDVIYSVIGELRR